MMGAGKKDLISRLRRVTLFIQLNCLTECFGFAHLCTR